MRADSGGVSGYLCYEGHPPLGIGSHVVYGGSCYTPVIMDADVYVNLDQGVMPTRRSLPWTPGEEFLFPISNYQAPKSPEQFGEMIRWLCGRIDDGLKIHVGCIGGHGRTGLVLAALVASFGVSGNPVDHVREHYCDRSVETRAQVDFLVKYWGCAEVPCRIKESKGKKTDDLSAPLSLTREDFLWQ